MQVTRERFEALVAEALDSLPRRFQKYLKNVAVVVDDVPPGTRNPNTRLLGLYHGVPRLSRQGTEPLLPDKVILYQNEIQSICRTESELIEQIRQTVWHEVGHHFGFSDKELRRLEARRAQSLKSPAADDKVGSR